MKAYLDNSATTRPSPAVAAAVSELMESGWYNPSALYRPAMDIQKRMDSVREVCLQAAGAGAALRATTLEDVFLERLGRHLEKK